MEDFEILFVDDDTTILSLVEEYLSAFNYRVSVVETLLRHLSLLRKKILISFLPILKCPISMDSSCSP
jgi:DNA-binding response OmpR family regulator